MVRMVEACITRYWSAERTPLNLDTREIKDRHGWGLDEGIFGALRALPSICIPTRDIKDRHMPETVQAHCLILGPSVIGRWPFSLQANVLKLATALFLSEPC